MILAGVTLKIVLDDNFVDKTQKAVDKYSEAQKNETEQIKYFLENYLGEVDNTQGSEHRTLNGAEPAYNNPIIPVGFKTSSEGASWTSIDGKAVQGWNDGLVIEDKDGNQFVWVPVDGTNVTYGYHYSVYSTGDESLEQSLPDGVTSEQDQINKYQGFYIARYEAGTDLAYANRDDETKAPLSKKNKNPWNNISWSNAKTSAESMYTGSSLKSGLITDRMWETTLQWLENVGVNVKTDCTEWGNYENAPVTGITKYSTDYGQNWESEETSVTKGTSNSWLLPTGHSDYTSRKNIYDLAGNLWECTNAAYDSSLSAVRGGTFFKDGLNYVAAYRSGHSDIADFYIGFRVGLYVM